MPRLRAVLFIVKLVTSVYSVILTVVTEVCKHFSFLGMVSQHKTSSNQFETFLQPLY